MSTKFITDLGVSPELVNEATGETTTLGRYAVWASAAAYRKAEVIEVSDDLNDLQVKHGPNLPVYGSLGAQTTPERP